MKSRVTKFLKWFWGSWNESVMFLLGIAFFFLWPIIYRSQDGTAGAFDAGILHVIPTGFLIVQFILLSSWISYKASWPKLGRWFDDKLEDNVVTVHSSNGLKASVFTFGVYIFYVVVHSVIFIALL
ncbi:hypothetical protein [Roseivirga seohaensis]|uniref:hypothetical protein n=1 Tax=Roseivirga seohaensis TaxID=1914963 RepID=UPI003BA99F28